MFEWTGNKKIEIASLPYHNKTFYEVSPDGTLLFTYNTLAKQGVLWEIAKLKNRKSDSVEIGTSGKEIYSVAFSPDSRKIAIGYANAGILWDTEGKLIDTLITLNYTERNTKEIRSYGEGNLPQYNFSKDEITAINFSPDGQLVVLGTYRGKVLIWDMAKRKNYIAPIDLKDEFKPGNYLTRVSLSSDNTKLLANTNYGNKIVYYDIDSNMVKKSLVCSDDKSRFDVRIMFSEFLDNNTAISADDMGCIYIWKINADYASINEALTALPILHKTLEEKLAEDSLYIKEILSSGDTSKLDSAASVFSDLAYSEYEYSYDKSAFYENKAKEILKKLVLLSTREIQKKFYLNKIDSLNEGLNAVEHDNEEPDYSIIVERLKENVMILKGLLKQDPTDTTIKTKLSFTYWDLSWNQLFADDYMGAIHSATSGLELNDKNNGIITNMALGYLLNDQYTEAEALYRKYRNERYADKSGRIFKDVFLKDFQDLEAAGIITPDNTELYEKVSKIRAMLLNY